MTARPWGLALCRAIGLALFMMPAALYAQGGKPCEILITGVVRGADTTRFTSVITGSGGRNTYVGGVVDATCEGQGNRLLADSAEHFADQGVLILYHNVRYTDPRMRINSDKMFYYTREDRLVAEGNVRGISGKGTRFAGPQMEYYRQKAGVRDYPYWVATGRPFMRMSPTESGAAPGTSTDSVDLTANRIYSFNDSLVWASGQVIIERPDLRATADSASLDNGTEFARLMRQPKIVGKGARSFTLVGVEIDMWSEERALERVRSSGEAKVDSDSLTLTADTIDLRLVDQQMERIYTWGGRSRAVSAQQDIESDSMDIRMPKQQLERVHAIGRALAWSRVDTARITTTERDWIAGDTIDAQFETTAVTDSVEARTQMRLVIANGSARAFYQLPPPGGAKGAPNLSYNRGRTITVLFDAGEMSTVTVSEKASGLYFEAPPAANARATPASTSTDTPVAPPAAPAASRGRKP